MRQQRPQVFGPVAKTLKYGEAQEHFLRRLASAVILHWDELPDAVQDLLIDQAAIVDDRHDAPHARENIENFLRSAKIGPLKPKSDGDSVAPTT